LLVDDHLHGGHVVHFYATDTELVDVAGEFLADGLRAGESCLVVATPSHRCDLETKCDPNGSARREGRLILVDAVDTLQRFMADGSPIAGDFNTTIVEILERLPANTPRRVYGEMVGVLWSEGNVSGAVSVEELWNALPAHLGFSLFCGYPSSVAFPLDEVSSIRDLHTSMVGAPPRQIDAELSQTFVSSTWSLRAARRFVSTTISEWGFDGVAADAELIASELATNAVSHARSHFSVGLSRLGNQVRIAVGDADNTPPIVRAPNRAGVGGLGLHLIESLATCWGYEIDSHGKIVWADIACESASAG
jgi:anti-sigma regulatory factor (Ser/Thr protein kinase)